jgi:hypothetical protein
MRVGRASRKLGEERGKLMDDSFTASSNCLEGIREDREKCCFAKHLESVEAVGMGKRELNRGGSLRLNLGLVTYTQCHCCVDHRLFLGKVGHIQEELSDSVE